MDRYLLKMEQLIYLDFKPKTVSTKWSFKENNQAGLVNRQMSSDEGNNFNTFFNSLTALNFHKKVWSQGRLFFCATFSEENLSVQLAVGAEVHENPLWWRVYGTRQLGVNRLTRVCVQRSPFTALLLLCSHLWNERTGAPKKAERRPQRRRRKGDETLSNDAGPRKM